MVSFTNFQLRGFHGFYNSIWSIEDSDRIEYEVANILGVNYDDLDKTLEAKGVTTDDIIDLNFNEYCLEVAKKYPHWWCNVLNDKLFYNSIITELDMGVSQGKGEPKLFMPKFYNFDSDMITCDVNFSDGMIAEIVKNVGDKYKDDILSDFTSRDGFASTTSNDWNVWENELLTNPTSEDGQKYLEVLLSYIMNEYECEMDIYCQVNGHGTNIENYYYLNNKGTELFSK